MIVFSKQILIGISILTLTCGTALAQADKDTITLQDAIQKTLQTHPELKIQNQQLLETKETLEQARSGWRPTVTTQANAYKSYIDNSNFSGADGAFTKEFSFIIDQPIWRGGQTFSQVNRAKELINADTAQLEKSENILILNIIQIYESVRRDRKLLALYFENEAMLLRELHAAQERFALGDTTKTDIERARAKHANATALRLNAQRNLNIITTQFEIMTGTTPPPFLAGANIPTPLPENVNDMIETSLTNNLDFTIAEHQKQAAHYEAQRSYRERLPQVAAYASYNKQYDPQPGIIDDSQNKTIGIQATWTLYEGGASRSRTRQAKLAEKRNEYLIEKLQRDMKEIVIKEAQNYYTSIAEKQIKAVEVEASNQTLIGIKEEMRMGQKSLLEVLDTTQDYIDAKAEMIQAEHTEIMAKFSLAYTLGLLNTDNFGI